MSNTLDREKVYARCTRELERLIEDAGWLDLDEMTVQALRTAIEAMALVAAAPEGAQGQHYGYVVDGVHFYHPDFPRSEWSKHKSVVPVYTTPPQPQDAAHAIPAGWRLTRVEGGGIAVCGPNGGPTVWAHGRSNEARTLYALADAVLASTSHDAARLKPETKP